MITVGYIGFGNSVIRYHLPYVAKRKHIKVVAIYRREEDRRLDKERESCYPEITFTSDLDNFLGNPKIDLVVINTPNHTHKEYAMLALQHGKHILVEKPFTLSSKDAKEIFALAKEKKLIACANQNRRFDADYLGFKEVVNSGKLGKLIEVESHYDYFKSQPVVTTNMIYNLGIHTLDQMIALFGIPKEVRYDVRGVLHENNGDDYFDIELYYPSNFKISVKTSLFVKLNYPRFLAHGKKGSYLKNSQGHLYTKEIVEPYKANFNIEEKENWGTLSYIDDYGNDITMNLPSHITDYGRIYDNLHDCILYGAEKEILDDEVIEVLRIVENAKSRKI